MSILSFSKGPSVSIDHVLTDSGKDLVPVVFEAVELLDEEFSEKVFRDDTSRTFEQVVREKSARSK